MSEPSKPHAEGLLTSEELAAALRCTVRHIEHMRRRGLPCVRVGRLLRFELRQVIDFLAARDQQPAGSDGGEMAEDRA